jgi:phospholipid/cholesterol/gamma-HCH transport system substrate-binding protein
VTYDLKPIESLQGSHKPLSGSIVVPEVTTVLLYDTQKLLVRPEGSGAPAFANARWGDTLPKLIQARIVHSFENASFLGVVTKPIDGLVPKYQLLIDLRRFQISMSAQPLAEVEFSATIMGDDGKVVAARLFRVAEPTPALDPSIAADALNEAFQKATTELITWTAASLQS